MQTCLVLLCMLGVAVVLANEEPASEDLRVSSKKVNYAVPLIPMNAFLAETFDSGLGSRWVRSEAKKDDTDEDIAKYNGEWAVKEADSPAVHGDVGLVLTTKARHSAIAAKLNRPFTFSGKPLIVQYEVKYQNGMDCGGSYMKLLSDTPKLDLKEVTDKSGYTIMFGPDTCGADKKLHFIMRHKHPLTGEFEEKHAKKASGNLDFYADKKTHLFRLTVLPDNSWEVHVDDAMINSGSLLGDMSPPVSPPAQIEDPEDFKPADWDDREKIPDPDATKPIDWDEDAPEFITDEEAAKPSGWLDDETEYVADSSSEKPSDWDEEMDGEWEPAKIENPKCKEAPGCGEWTRPNKRNPDYRGKWRPEMIENPDYSGVWAARKIDNPNFFEDAEPYRMTPIGAIAFELWTMTDAVLFDSILITDDVTVADRWTSQTWHIKRDAELAESAKNAPSMVQPLLDALEDKPWLWGVLVLALLIPLGLIVYCCTGSKDEAADKKKTDAVTPDDEGIDQEGEDVDGDMAGGDTPTKESAGFPSKGSSSPSKRSSSPSKRGSSPSKRSSSPTKSGRAALSKPAEEEEDDDEEEEEEAAPSQEQEEEVSPDEGGAASANDQQEETESPRKSPRKRKSRKD